MLNVLQFDELPHETRRRDGYAFGPFCQSRQPASNSTASYLARANDENDHFILSMFGYKRPVDDEHGERLG